MATTAAGWGLSPDSNWKDPDNLVALNAAVMIRALECVVEGLKYKDALPPDTAHLEICEELHLMPYQLDMFLRAAHTVMVDRDLREMDDDEKDAFINGGGDTSLLPEGSMFRTIAECCYSILEAMGYDDMDQFMAEAREHEENRHREIDMLNELFNND
jgi:hypothetical protein